MPNESDDLVEKIGSILSDKESLKQLGELAAMLGFPPPAGETSQPVNSSGTFSQTGVQKALPPQQSEGFDISKLMSMASMLQGLNSEDDNIRLILALKPLLSEDKRAKADRAVKILKIINLLPLIKESGLLGGDFLGIL